MGMSKNPGILDYWSKKNPLYYNSTFPATISRNQYQLIHKFLHFADNEDADKVDRLHKIKYFVVYLTTKFQEIYTLERGLCISEQLLLHKSNLNFKLYTQQTRQV